ncbi:MAG: nuclear transport factor 2 family protein [Bacteroidota bacterium]
MKKVYFFFVLIGISNSLIAQVADKEAIKATINKLFEGMQKNDSAMAHSVFHHNARLNTIGYSKKNMQNYFIADDRVSGFLEAIAKPKTENWREQATSFDIRIDKQMAQAWVPYTFHLGDKFSHCGVDNFVLFKEKTEWKIIYLVDTMREENCAK